MTFRQQTVEEVVRTDAQSTMINPDEISAFKTADLQLRQFTGKEIAERLIITPKILIELVEPVSALVIGCLKGDNAKGIHIAHLIDINRTIDAATPRRILRNDIGNLQTCGIEVLRRRIHHDAVVCDSAEGHKLITWHDEFTMDFIRDHLHAVLLADIVHLLQFLALPDASARIMRIAEQEERRLLVCAFRLKVLPIHLKSVSHSLQRTFEHLTTVVLNR